MRSRWTHVECDLCGEEDRYQDGTGAQPGWVVDEWKDHDDLLDLCPRCATDVVPEGGFKAVSS